ncbi:MAG: hypothetical protein PVI26_05995 [Chitinispirillia bacterium]|jgi:hypothetical protein
MVKKYLLPFILMSLCFLNCELVPENNGIFNPIINQIFKMENKNIHEEVKGEGLCIFPTNIQYNSILFYQNYNIDTARIIDGPIISYSEIISYDTTTHFLDLALTQASLRSRLGSIPVNGKSFLVTLDSEKMYVGWFWVMYSSFSSPDVTIHLDLFNPSSTSRKIQIRFEPTVHNPSAKDPRKNRKIFNRLIKDGKAR